MSAGMEMLTTWAKTGDGTAIWAKGEIERLREALKPFALAAEFMPPHVKDTDGVSMTIKVTDWRRALDVIGIQ